MFRFVERYLTRSKWLFLLVLVFRMFPSDGQSLDSLQRVLSTLSKEDERYVHTLWEVADAVRNVNKQQALDYTYKAYQVCKAHFPKLKDRATVNFAEQLVFINLPDSADLLLNEVQAPLHSKSTDSLAFCKYFFLKGKVASGRNRVKEAIGYNDSALNVAINIGDLNGLGLSALHELGMLYDYQDIHNMALDYYGRALNLYEKNRDSSGIAAMYNNISGVYSQDKKYRQSDTYMDSSMWINEQIGSVARLITNYGNSAIAFTERKDFAKAWKYIRKLESIAPKTSNPLYHGFIANVKSKYYIAMEDLRSAQGAALEAYRIGKDNKIEFVLSNAYDNLLKVSVALKQYQDAYLYQKDWNILKDSLEQVNQKKVLLELQTKYETKKKETENRQLLQANAQQTHFNRMLMTGGSVLIIALGLLTFFYSKLQKNKKTIERQSKELRKLDNLKSEFFANISHELRTPLTLLNGQLEGLQVKALQPLEKEERVKKAKRNTRQLGQMIDDLLDLSRLELGTMKLSLQPVNIVQYVKRVVASFQSLAESRKIVLLVDVPKDVEDLAVMLDTRQFEKVLNNLLYNAFKFTSPGGQTSVKIEKATDHVHINVFNTGNAIPEQELERLFDRFYQASNNGTNTGSGLGLAIAREIVELHGGKIAAANVEGGVLFTVNVPSSVQWRSQPEAASDDSQFGEQILKSDPEFEISEVIDSKLPGIKSNKPVVLVVEDNEEMRAYVHEVLSDYFNLEGASNGKEALVKLATLKPDLILADVMMPEMNGFELLDNLKKSAAYFDIPVMFLTALASQDDKLKGLRMGLDDYLVKPFDREELVIRVANLISNLRRRIALARELEKEGEHKIEGKPATATDEKLIRQAQAYIESNIGDTNLSVKTVAGSAGMSERQLYRKVAALMGMTPNEFITEVKLQYARRLLLAGKVVKLSQLAHELGYAKDSHFSNLFFQRFGKRPGDYIG